MDRAIGTKWNIEEDKLEFNVKLKEKPLTRKGMLSIISSIKSISAEGKENTPEFVLRLFGLG